MPSKRVSPRHAPQTRWRAVGRSRPPTAGSFAINVTVGDVMSRSPITIGPEATLLDALVLMRGHRISGLPVVDDHARIVGVLSQRDIARILESEGGIPEVTGLLDLLTFGISDERGVSIPALRQILQESTVRDAMSSPPIVISPEASLELAADMMRESEINRIPVLRKGRLVGIFTRNDLVRAFVPA